MIRPASTFAHTKIGLDKLLFAFYSFLRFNTSIRQLDAKIDVSYRSLRRRVEQFTRTLDAPAIDLVGPVEIDEVSVPHKASSAIRLQLRLTPRLCSGSERLL